MLVSDVRVSGVGRNVPSGLNPCFSGCWSRTPRYGVSTSWKHCVLILVLVDVGLGRDEVIKEADTVVS